MRRDYESFMPRDEGARPLDALETALLDRFQRGFPLTEEPFRDVAAALGTEEAAVIAALDRLEKAGIVSRVGAVVRPHAAGWSTLAALAVPEARLEEVARIVSSYAEVNHNYEREHRVNLWFVVTGLDRDAVEAVLDGIARRTGLGPLVLELLDSYHIDLGFPL